jgi:8-oxo-dGTP pyrophosphatase MutT (NUDIX family)
MEFWKILESTYTYRDQWLAVRSETVLLPNGQTLKPFHTVEGPDSVNIVAISRDGNIVLVEQYRHPIGRVMLELPAGHVDSGEDSKAAAQRELLEETGYGQGQWHDLGILYPLSSRFSAQVRGWLALGVVPGQVAHSHGEVIRVRELPWQEFFDNVRANTSVAMEASQLAFLFLANLHIATKAGAGPNGA